MREPIPAVVWDEDPRPVRDCFQNEIGLWFERYGATWLHVRVEARGIGVPLALAGLRFAGSDMLEGPSIPFLPADNMLRSLADRVQEAVLAGDVVLAGYYGGRLEMIPREAVNRFGIDFDRWTVGPFEQVRAAFVDHDEAAKQAAQRETEADATPTMKGNAQPTSLVNAETAARKRLAEWAESARHGGPRMLRRENAKQRLMESIPGLSGEGFLRAWRAVARDYPELTQGGRPSISPKP